MKKSLLALLAVAFAARAQAQTRSAKAEPSPWGRPVANTVSQLGTLATAGIGTNFMRFAVEKGHKLNDFFVDRPYTLDRLGAQLANMGHTPASLSELAPSERAALIATAAGKAEQAVQKDRAAFIEKISKGVNASNVDSLQAEASRVLYADAPYASEESNRETIKATQAIYKFRRKRLDDFLKRVRGVPADVDRAKLGDQVRMFVKSEDGWAFSDDPTRGRATAQGALEARLVEAVQMPDGPWKGHISDSILDDVLSRPGSFAQALESEGVSRKQIGSLLDAAFGGVFEAEKHSDAALRPTLKHFAALPAGEAPSSKHVVKAIQYYESASFDALSYRKSPSTQLWIAKGLTQQQVKHYPTLTQLKAWRDAAVLRLRRTRNGILAGVYGGMAVTGIGLAAANGGLVLTGMVSIVLAGLVAIVLTAKAAGIESATTHFADRIVAMAKDWRAKPEEYVRSAIRSGGNLLPPEANDPVFAKKDPEGAEA